MQLESQFRIDDMQIKSIIGNKVSVEIMHRLETCVLN